MQYRTFPRTGWQVSEVGCGTWGMGGWTGAEDRESLRAMHRAIELGCNFFDTAWVYGQGRSERLLRQALAAHRDRRIFVATKIPPKNLRWPARAECALHEVFPADHIREYTERSLENLGLDRLDLQQFHVWSDTWADDERWQLAISDLKQDGLVGAFGISVNRWEPANVLRALQTRLVDAVQVVHNIFDQAPEDELFPMCRELNVAVIARVPFDEGSLTGALTHESRWPEGDWRNTYFTPENLAATLERVERLKPLVPPGMSLPQLALKYILQHSAVTTTIPGMRTVAHVEHNLAASDERPLPDGLYAALKVHRWDRTAVIE